MVAKAPRSVPPPQKTSTYEAFFSWTAPGWIDFQAFPGLYERISRFGVNQGAVLALARVLPAKTVANAKRPIQPGDPIQLGAVGQQRV